MPGEVQNNLSPSYVPAATDQQVEQETGVVHMGREYKPAVFREAEFCDKRKEIIAIVNSFLKLKEKMVFYHSSFTRLSKSYNRSSAFYRAILDEGGGNLRGEGLEELVKYSPNMRRLTYWIKPYSIINLQYLYSKINLQCIASLIHLQSLTLSSRDLPRIDLSALLLQSLTLSYMRELTSLDLSTQTQLQSLTIENCPNLFGLNLSTQTQLQSLTIESCPNSLGLDLSTQTQLQSLTLRENRELTEVDLPTQSLLESLTIENCPNLTGLDLSTQTKVKSLTLVGRYDLTGCLSLQTRGTFTLTNNGLPVDLTQTKVKALTLINEQLTAMNPPAQSHVESLTIKFYPGPAGFGLPLTDSYAIVNITLSSCRDLPSLDLPTQSHLSQANRLKPS